MVPTSRLAIAETHALRVTRSTEDILACPNGRTSPGAALSSGAAVSQLSIDDDDDLPRPSHILGQRKSVPTGTIYFYIVLDLDLYSKCLYCVVYVWVLSVVVV